MLASKHLCLLMLLPASLYAQDAATFSTPATFSTNVRVINLFATVRDAEDHVVPNLTKDDFTLTEDGRPQIIRYFSHEVGLPLTIGLLVDTSISQKRLLAEERAASFRFLSQVLRPSQPPSVNPRAGPNLLLPAGPPPIADHPAAPSQIPGPPSDRAFLIHFDRDVELLQDLTSSREQLEQALARLQTPQLPPRKHGDPKIGLWALGGTALYDAILLASEEVIQKDELARKQPARKALILLTDGVDNGSKVGLYRAIQSAQLADTLVYPILFADRDAYDGAYASANGKKAMQRIARETGGAFFEVTRNTPLPSIYALLEEELRNQYSIGYSSDSTDPAPGYRKIHLSSKPGLSVVTRDGYYATPQ